MADGSIVIQTTLDNSDAHKELQKLYGDIEKVENELNSKRVEKSAIEKELKSASDEAKKTEISIAEIKDGIASLQEIKTTFGIQHPLGLAEAEASLKEQEKILKSQDKEVERLSRQYTNITDSIIKSENSLDGMKARASEVSNQISSSSFLAEAFSERMNEAQESASKFKRRLLGIAKSALVFRVISSSLRSLVGYMGNVLRSNSEYSAQLAKLKGALLTAFQPIYEYILPGLVSILRVLTAIVQVVANVISSLFGKTADQSAKNAEALNKQAAAIGSVGDAAEEAKNQLSGFDEINKLSGETASGGGGGVSGITPDFSEFDTQKYKDTIDELTVYLSGSLLALGAILAFSGANITLGIALMAAGAIGLTSVIKENWGAMSNELRHELTNITLMLGASTLAVGAALAFSGANIPVGIGLMALGSVSLAAAATINWNEIEESLNGPLGGIVALLSSFLLPLGAILALSGANIPLGIALMAAGLLGFAVTTNITWGAISQELKNEVTSIMAIIGGAALVLGLVLAFSGANIPVGIGLMAIGAFQLATAASLNWDALIELLQGSLAKVTALASGALLAIGVVLVCSGIALPLGIALLAAGAAGLVTAAALNWDSLLESCKGVWDGITEWYRTKVATKFTISFWTEKFSGIAEGLKQAIKDGINGSIERFNSFISWINSAMNFSWGDFSLFGETIIPAGSMQLLSIPEIPYLAQGAVIPPNREFLAVLGDQSSGTNIEAPLSTIQEAVSAVVNSQQQMDLLREQNQLLQQILERCGVTIDGPEFARAVTDYQHRQNWAMGW